MTSTQLGAMMQRPTDEQITAACSAYTRASGTLRDVMRDVLAAALAPALLSASKPAAPLDPEQHGLPPYPKGNLVGPCVCGSWPGGECLKCRVIPAAPAQSGEPVALTEDQRGILDWCKNYHARRIPEGDFHMRIMTLINKLLTAPQPSPAAPAQSAWPILSGHAVGEIFLHWSEWTAELGEAISRKNIDGFVAELRKALADQQPSQPAQASEACPTCNGHGMIGGPSYYAPDEGGEPCPDCAVVLDDERAAFDRAALEAPGTLMAIGRLLQEAGYAPELRIIDAIRAVIADARAASPQATAPKARGDHAIWLLEALIDIYDDEQNNAPEDRCYAEVAWSATLTDIRAFLADKASGGDHG